MRKTEREQLVAIPAGTRKRKIAVCMPSDLAERDEIDSGTQYKPLDGPPSLQQLIDSLMSQPRKESVRKKKQ
jgi:hypothetical protein